jgi:hypothetical protein
MAKARGSNKPSKANARPRLTAAQVQDHISNRKPTTQEKARAKMWKENPDYYEIKNILPKDLEEEKKAFCKKYGFPEKYIIWKYNVKENTLIASW